MIPLFLLSAAIFVLIAYVVFRKVVRRDYLLRKQLSIGSYLLEILVFALHANLLYLLLPTPWPDVPQLPDHPVVQLVAGTVLVFGVILLLLAWFGLGTKTSLGQGKQRLHTTGLYQYSRNPQLLAYGLVLVAVAILYFSYLVLVWLLLYVLAAFFMIESEEEFLAIQYGGEYEAYCQAVPRVLKCTR
jgi:protein-S-isoprenylcysteine O-methyltransferase Ste14